METNDGLEYIETVLLLQPIRRGVAVAFPVCRRPIRPAVSARRKRRQNR